MDGGEKDKNRPVGRLGMSSVGANKKKKAGTPRKWLLLILAGNTINKADAIMVVSSLAKLPKLSRAGNGAWVLLLGPYQ